MITGEEKMVAWHTINFMMACEVPRLDELLDWLRERSGRTFANLDLIQLGFMDPDDPEDDPAYAKKWQLRRIVYASGKKYGWEPNCIYGSEQEHGGPSTFWKVKFHTISSFRVGGLYAPSFLNLVVEKSAQGRRKFTEKWSTPRR